jgi:lipoprotein-releasing system ATP-binding protein
VNGAHESLIQAVDVKKVLGSGGKNGVQTLVLRGVSLAIEEGEFVALVGPSGSGKSTLLYLLGLLDRPTEGEVRFEGRAIHELDDNALARVRNDKIGFIYQFHFLLPEFTALENVMIPMLAHRRASRAQARERAQKLLVGVDLEGQENKRPNQLSGGQQQRVAVCRALANSPRVILGDEPTGNLDTKNSAAIFDIFARLNQESRQTLVIVTHDLELARRANRVIRVRDGLIESDLKS